jgi:UDP:flavonoid glycosyltransferase YjiC (YdhE family)
MRILFTAVPAPGHLLPLLPLLEAARRAGHPVAVLSGRGAAGIVPSVEVFEEGPSVADAMAETGRRLGGQDGRDPGPGAVELFGAVRLDGVTDGAIDAARRFAPDLVVHDAMDFVGPLVAAVLGVPRVEHRISGPVPADLMRAIAARSDVHYASRGVARSAPAAVVDPYPDALLSDAERDRQPGRIALRPEPHSAEFPDGAVTLPALTGPVAVLTLGTSVREPGVMSSMAGSIAEAGISVLATVAPGELKVAGGVRDKVHEVGFVPLARLLPSADAVVSAGGTGTLLAALALGKPLVIRPFLADQPWNAQRAADRGVAAVIEDAEDAGDAVRKVIDDVSYTRAAQAIAEQLAALDDAGQVLQRLTARLSAQPAI